MVDKEELKTEPATEEKSEKPTISQVIKQLQDAVRDLKKDNKKLRSRITILEEQSAGIAHTLELTRSRVAKVDNFTDEIDARLRVNMAMMNQQRSQPPEAQ